MARTCNHETVMMLSELIGNCAVDSEVHIATIHEASIDSAVKVLSASEEGYDGRTQWLWVRLANGDLFFGCYPQGDLYWDIERDAQYPQEGRVTPV